jgi:serine protease Do
MNVHRLKWMALKSGAFVVLVFMVASGRGQATIPVSPEVASMQKAFVDVAKAVKPAVVNVATTRVDSFQAVQPEFYFGDPFQDFFGQFFDNGAPSQMYRLRPRTFQRRQEGLGSGVIIDPKGYVLTNAHVVHGAQEIKVTLPDGKSYNGKVAGVDERTDLAVVKVSASGSLPSVPLGDSDKAQVGEWVMAIGSPFGLEQTVTAGIISAVRQSLTIEGRVYRDLLQTDAAINPGNSGGPLVNLSGEVVGINTAIYAPTGVFSGVGFAIPVNRMKPILKELIESGRVVRGWMGVELVTVDEAVAKQFELASAEGALINSVLDDSPAQKAGLKRGDVIQGYDGKPVGTVEELEDLVAQTPPSKKVALKVIRDGKERTLTLVTGEMPAREEPLPGEEAAPPSSSNESQKRGEWGGAVFVPANLELANQHELPSDREGMVVVEVNSDGEASAMGLLPGDLVVAVNRTPVPTTSEFKKATSHVKTEEGVVFDINRRGRQLYLTYQKVQ